MYQKVFKSAFIDNILRRLEVGKVAGTYPSTDFKFDVEDTLLNKKMDLQDRFPELLTGGGDEDKNDFENAKKIFEYYKGMNPTQASDTRLWTYLAHTDCRKYLQKRWAIEGKTEEEQKTSILTHWFIPNLSARSLARHGVAWLWWGAYLTYDNNRENPYELTKEFFEMKDLVRTTLEETLGRNRNFLHAVLEFMIENERLFSNYKQDKVRFLVRKANLLAGYKIFAALSKKDIKNIFSTFLGQINCVANDNPEGLK